MKVELTESEIALIDRLIFKEKHELHKKTGTDHPISRIADIKLKELIKLQVKLGTFVPNK